MKLINFKTFEPFKEIRKKLEISDDYTPNFKGNKAIIEAMKWEDIKTTGLDISIDELNVAPDGTLEHKNYPGQKMIVYIRDYNGSYNSTPKFHISWCSTLKNMTESGKYNRYVVSQRNDGLFTLNKMMYGKSAGSQERELDVCKNCLRKLNYNNYSRKDGKIQNEIVRDFKVKDFLEKYNTEIILEPKYNEKNQPLNEYPESWDVISKNYRMNKNWKCEVCGKDMTYNQRNLHVHHISGNKFDVSPSNLEAVCVDCHSNKPLHGHMKANPMFRG